MLKKIFLLLVLTLSACSTMNGPKPEISLVDLQFRDMTFFETTGLFTIRIENQGPYPLVISGASYEIEINGIRIGRGTSDETMTIPRLGSSTQQVQVHLNNLSVISNIRPLIESRNFEYRIDGTLYKPGSFGMFGIDVDAHHRFEMPTDGYSPNRLNQPLR